MLTPNEKQKYMTMQQQVLPFEFWKEEEKERQAVIQALPYYPEPENDNQKLFNLQKEYYEGRESALVDMFTILNNVAPKLINIEMNSTKRYFTQDKIDELAIDAVCLFIRQIKKNNLKIQKSFIAYLRLQVLKVVNNQTKAQQFEKYCKENKINIFYLSEEEKANVKLEFEKKLEGEKK